MIGSLHSTPEIRPSSKPRVSQAPSTSSPAHLAPGQPAQLLGELSFTHSTTQLRQDQGQETQFSELCLCLQTLMLAGSFLAWLGWRQCQSRSGMRPGWSGQNKGCPGPCLIPWGQ